MWGLPWQVRVVSFPPHTALMCSAPHSPGHHGSPLCQLGLLQSVSWAWSLCGEECSPRTSPKEGISCLGDQRAPSCHPWPKGSRVHPGAPSCLPLGYGLALDSPVLGQWSVLEVEPQSWAGAHSTSPLTQEMPAQGTGTPRAARRWRPRQPTPAASASICLPLLCWPSHPRTW